jgi:hypothetical protein
VLREETRPDEASMRPEAAITRSIDELGAAHTRALATTSPAVPPDFDALWLAISLDRWLRMPAKIHEVSQLGQLHVAVTWDQDYAICVYPRPIFSDLTALLRYLRECATDGGVSESSTQWRALFADRWPLARCLDAQRDRWRQFVDRFRCIESDGAVYVDLADVMRGCLSPFSGHWTFDDVVLHRYVGDEIDFDFYASRRFDAPHDAERFERFAAQMRAARIDRDSTWNLFSPSGERIWKLVAVFTLDGNTDAILLEGDGEFLTFRASGS